MDRRTVFNGRLLPVLLLAPQLLLTVFFFYWPAGQAAWSSLTSQDAFGQGWDFVGIDNFHDLLTDRLYLESALRTVFFCVTVSALAMTAALTLAIFANRAIAGRAIYRTLLIWPYAIAPAMAAVLWLLLLHPQIGLAGAWLNRHGIAWDYHLNDAQAMLVVVLACAWKQVSYNFLFFLAGLQSIPKSLIEAAAIDGARPVRRFWTIVFPLLSPTSFFLLVINIVYAFFDTFGIVDAATQGGPGKATSILVYKVYYDGFKALDLGGSAAQSVVLMAIVIVLTVAQFKFVEKKVNY